MAYRVKIGANLEKDVRRLLMAQVGRALAHLSSTADTGLAIHETRKSLKRCRSVLRLVEPGLDKRSFQRTDHSFRAIARVLSHQRDRQVMTETLAKLVESRQAISDAAEERRALEAVRTAIAGKAVNGAAPGEHSDDLAADIRLALSMLKEADVAIRRLRMTPARIATLARGFAGTYRASRASMKAAYRSGEDEDFHAFRKCVQHHWRHLQLLSPAWPELMEVRIASARALAQALGNDHDLSVLADHLAGERMQSLPVQDRETVIAIARAEQARLRVEAEGIARRLFAQSPRDLERLILKLWPAAVQIAAREQSQATAIVLPSDDTLALVSDN